MLELQQIKEQYPDSLRVFERALVREYLQCKILQAIFESSFASSLSFLGGTALRIVHGNNRFSEDIDLDNFGVNFEEFGEVMHVVKRALELDGLLVEVSLISKGAYHCSLRFPELLYQQGLTAHQSEKILIQVDTVAQEYGYRPENRILNKFDVFSQILVTPLNILLSQKIYAAINRKRPKGRDFYDITFLFSRTKPDIGYIYEKMGISSLTELRIEVNKIIENFDFKNLADDVSPFLISKDEVKRILNFKQFWMQVEME